MKKNFASICIALFLILIAMLFAGLILTNIYIICIAAGLMMLGGIGISAAKVYKIYKDVKNPDDQTAVSEETQEIKGFMSKTKSAWEFSTVGEKTKSIFFVVTFLLCAIAFIVLCRFSQLKIAFIVLFGGIVFIVLCILAMDLIEKYLIKKHNAEANAGSKQNNEYAAAEDVNACDATINASTDNAAAGGDTSNSGGLADAATAANNIADAEDIDKDKLNA